MTKEYKGHLIANKMSLALVVARFNDLITKSLLSGALEALERYAIPEEKITLAWVPGSFEIPLVAQQLALTKKYDAIICLGAVIRGSTPHFEYVASQVSSGLAQLSLQHQLPFIFGILTTDTLEQAIERAGTKGGNKGFEAVQSAIEMVDLLRQIR